MRFNNAFMHCIALQCNALCNAMHHAMQCINVLYASQCHAHMHAIAIAMQRIVQCNAFCNAMHQCIASHRHAMHICIRLHCIALHRITLYCISIHCIVATLQCIALQCASRSNASGASRGASRRMHRSHRLRRVSRSQPDAKPRARGDQ